MAPRQKSVKNLSGICDEILKENNYLRCLSDYQSRVRRRDTLRNKKPKAVSLFFIEKNLYYYF